MNTMLNYDLIGNAWNMPTASHNDATELKGIKSAALRLLARRDYSRLELYRKLSQKFTDVASIQQILDELRDQGYQSDERFAESYIRSRVSSGNGPFKIKIELREKGVCESTVLSALDRQKIDWLEQAQAVRDKHFANQAIDSRELSREENLQYTAKQIRYLKNKGFYQEHIEQVVNNSATLYC